VNRSGAGIAAAHGQRVGRIAIDDLQRGGQHQLAGDLAVLARVLPVVRLMCSEVIAVPFPGDWRVIFVYVVCLRR
jgi:hypothetical protein